jgi:hypothetical protein
VIGNDLLNLKFYMWYYNIYVYFYVIVTNSLYVYNAKR